MAVYGCPWIFLVLCCCHGYGSGALVVDRITPVINVISYTLHITPQGFPRPNSFHGESMMSFVATHSVDWFELHSKHLSFGEFVLRVIGASSSHGSHMLQYDVDAGTERVRLYSPVQLEPDQLYSLSVTYTGRVDMDGHTIGVFTQDYNTTRGEHHTMMATTLRPNHARSLLPCMDNPEYKARFSVIVTRPADWEVLSNAPMERSLDDRNGWRTDIFQPTTPLSTFHLIVVIFPAGDWHVTSSSRCQHVTCKLWQPTAVEKNADGMLKYVDSDMMLMTEYTQIKMPFPKMDFFSILDYHTSAFEHPGLITLDDASLVRPEIPGLFHMAAKTVTHELGHQWFGNLVTPTTWGDLWISEGLTTFLAYHALMQHDHALQFVFSDAHSKTRYIMWIDTVFNTMPLYQEFKGIPEKEDIYQPLTWTKGCAVAKVLEAAAGHHTFRRVIQILLTRHKWSTLSVAEFLEELEYQTIGKVTASSAWEWFTDTGYPVITVNTTDTGLVLHISHMGYSNRDGIKHDYPGKPFRGCLTITYEVKYVGESPEQGDVVFPGDVPSVILDLSQYNLEYFFLNVNGLYARVHYETLLWWKIVNNFNNISSHVGGQVSLYGDIEQLAQDGELLPALRQKIISDDNPHTHLWNQILGD